jgi:hypothetical protein
LKLYRVLSLLFIFILVFSSVPNLAGAAESAATIEKLVKTAEAQSSKLVKQMSSSNAKDINVVSTQTSNNLNAAIKKAKTSISKFKGKQKAAFEKRIKAVDQTLVNVKTYNTAITNGNKLTTQLTTFKKTFDSNPFDTEKLFLDLKTKNAQFTKELTKLTYKGSKIAFSTKYQTEVNKELNSKQEFYDIKKQIDSFVDFSKSNEDMEVWEEFYTINEVIDESSLNDTIKDTLFEKWYETYYPTMVEAEEEDIKKFVTRFFGALNARDAEAIAELFPIENELQKQILIEVYKYVFGELPESYSIEAKNIVVEFVHKNQASVYVEVVEVEDGKATEDISTMFLTRVDGKWVFIGETYEEYFIEDIE